MPPACGVGMPAEGKPVFRKQKAPGAQGQTMPFGAITGVIMYKKIFLTMFLAGGLILAANDSFAQNNLPDSDTLNAIAQGNAPDPNTKKQLKQLEKAVKQNMKSSEYMIRAAQAAGASQQDVAKLKRLSVNFMKTFLAALTPSTIKEGQTEPQARPQQPKQQPRQPLNIVPSQPAPQPQANAPQGNIPQGIIITGPDGTQWLVTPQAQQQLTAPRAQNQVAPQAPDEEEVVIIEEDIAPEMPLWPSKEQLGGDGVLKYLEKRSQNQ